MKKKSSYSLFILALFTLSNCELPPIRSTEYSYLKPIELSDSIQTDDLSQVGMDKVRIENLTKQILADSFPNIHSLLILRDGKLVYENYFAGKDEILGERKGYLEHKIDDLHDCRSISKTVTSACIGVAVRKGLIKSIDTPIFRYFTKYQDKFDEEKKKITIRHLLTMTSGLKWNEDISYRDPRNTELRMDISSDPISFILGRPIVSTPGTLWNYNGGNTQLLSEIVKLVSGSPLDEFAEKELFTPLGIKKYEWLSVGQNIPAAASGLRLRSRDLLKLGMLYINKGNHKNIEILSEDWISQSLKSSIVRPSSKDNKSGYGYQFWTSVETINGREIEIREAKGNGGQRVFICRSLNLVVVITAGNYNNWDIKNDSKAVLLNYIIPAMN